MKHKKDKYAIIFSERGLKRYIKCACNFESIDGYLYSYRYSNEQIERFFRPDGNDFWAVRTKFSSGVRIEIVTTSTEISFDYVCDDYTSEHNTFDLYVNDVLTEVHRVCEHKEHRCAFELCEGKKKVAIYLPCDTRVGISYFCIDGTFDEFENGENVLLIGDSISQGYGPALSGSAYVNALMRKTGFYILNQSVGGYRFEPDDIMKVEGFEPSKIIVELGTNYHEKGLDYDYKKSCKEFFARLVQVYGNEIPIAVITPLHRIDNIDKKRFAWCIELIKSECAKYENIALIDGFSLMPSVKECFLDCVHPNAFGSELIAKNLARTFKKIGF
jgi:lysophospholipase L1-like esterase